MLSALSLGLNTLIQSASEEVFREQREAQESGAIELFAGDFWNNEKVIYYSKLIRCFKMLSDISEGVETIEEETKHTETDLLLMERYLERLKIRNQKEVQNEGQRIIEQLEKTTSDNS